MSKIGVGFRKSSHLLHALTNECSVPGEEGSRMSRPAFFELLVLESRSLRRKEALVRLDTGTGRLYINSAGLNARAFEACYKPPRLVIYEL